jgi:hypothetical protein
LTRFIDNRDFPERGLSRRDGPSENQDQCDCHSEQEEYFALAGSVAKRQETISHGLLNALQDGNSV